MGSGPYCGGVVIVIDAEHCILVRCDEFQWERERQLELIKD